MPAKSKAQQRFFGMVRAAQKGEMENPSSEILDVADDISVKDAKKMAKTKHKGLPEKVKEQVKRDEYGDLIGGPKISKKQKEKNLKSNTPDEQHTTTTSEGSSYGLYKGSGKPSGPMAAFAKKKKKVKKEVVDEARVNAVIAKRILQNKKKCADCGSYAHVTGASNCPSKKDPEGLPEGVMDIVRKYGKKKPERKAQKAQDAGARLRRKVQRREYAAKVSGSEDLVPDDIRDHKTWSEFKKYLAI